MRKRNDSSWRCETVLQSGVIRAGLLLLTLLAAGTGCLKSPENDFQDCLSCHRGVESPGSGHTFGCPVCHLHRLDRGRPLDDHSPILVNPSRMATAEQVCGQCHQDDVETFQTSLHLTLAGMINQTRFLFGAQASAVPAVYGAGGALEPLPHSPPDPAEPGDLVDDLLRRKCLQCHVSAVGAAGNPPYRARGCAACHVPYAADGRYRGNDQSIDRSSAGHPRVHGLTADIPDAQCLKCHRPNYVGSDGHGLFERDYDSFFQEAVLGEVPAQDMPQGAFHGLARDVHQERGMSCLDCHHKQDVMGDGHRAAFALDSPGTTCQDCHGGFSDAGPNPEVEGLQNLNGTWFFQDRQGRNRLLPIFRATSPSHDPAVHSRLRCSSCHARWIGHDYGLSLQRQDGGDFRVWTYLTRQGDPGLLTELNRLLADPEGSPTSRDLLTGETTTGLWLKGYRFRRWENRVLGVDHQNRISLMKPLHQYQVSYVDRAGSVLLDSEIPIRGDGQAPGWAFMPSVPHTTGSQGRPCETCHRNPVAAGLGLAWDGELEAGPDFDLLHPSPPAVPGMRLLNPRERDRLLEPGSGYGQRFFKQKQGLLESLGPGLKQTPGSKGLAAEQVPRTRSNRLQQGKDDS